MNTTVPTKKPASELEPGDWVDTDDGDTAEVLSVHPYVSGGTPMVSVVYPQADDGVPYLWRVKADHMVTLTAAAEIENTRAHRLRWQIADRMHDFANLVANGLPIDGDRVRVTIDFGRDVSQIAEISERLGIKVDVDSVGRTAVWWPGEVKSYEPGFHAEFFAYDPKFDKPAKGADPTGLGFSREPDEVKPTSAVPNGVDGHSEFSGRASVPDMRTLPMLCLAVPSNGVRCGEPIYWNAAANAWWHQSRDIFNHTATGPSVPPSPDSDAAIYAKFAAAEAANNEQVKAWLDRHGITVVGAPAVSLRRGLVADHGEALAFAQLLGEPDDSRPCAHRGDSDDCECNGNDQPQGGE